MKPHQYQARVLWERRGADFGDNRYSRQHQWHFDGGAVVTASASPQVVPPPMAAADAVDPEEAFVASLSSCHMLFFLYHAGRKGLVVDRYEDEAVGTLGQGGDGRIAMLEVVLRPRVSWSGCAPTAAELEALHHQAHDDCFIANSVKTGVRVAARD